MKDNALNSLVSFYRSNIQHPFTLEEIVQKIESGDYNADLLLQHLLVWVVENRRNAQAQPRSEGGGK